MFEVYVYKSYYNQLTYARIKKCMKRGICVLEKEKEVFKMVMCQYKLILMQAIVIVYIFPTAQTQCEKHEAAGAFGNEVQLRICDLYAPPYDFIDVYTDRYNFRLFQYDWVDGWYWNWIHEVIDISVLITSEEYFGTVVVDPLTGPLTYVTIRQSGRPELCNNGDAHAQTLTANLGGSVHSTLCILNLDDSLRADIKVEQQSSIVAAESSLSSSFHVTVQQGTGSYHEQELVFEVTNMSEADVGNWTVHVDNTYGYLTIDVVIEAIAPPAMCDDEHQNRTISSHIDELLQFSICVLCRDGKEPYVQKISKFSESTQQYAASDNSLNVSISERRDDLTEHEVAVSIDSMSEEDAGFWVITVATQSGWLDIFFTLEMLVPPAMCDGERQDRTISSHVGEPLYFTFCIHCSDGKQPYIQNISKFSERTQQYTVSDSSLTVNISRRGYNLIEHEIGVSVDSMSEEDAGLWVITVATQSGWLDIFFALEMLVPPAMCDGERQDRTISSYVGEPLYFTFCIQCIDGKEPYIQSISKFSERTQQYAAVDNSLTVSISERGDDLTEHEIGVSIDSMSEEDAGLWVITVATQSGWLDIFFTLEMLEQRSPPSAVTDGASSNDALAIGLGLTSVVIVIAIVVGVVWAIRRFRGKEKTETALSNSGDTTENSKATHTTHINQAFTSESETTRSKATARERPSVEVSDTSRMSKEKTLGKLDHVSGSLVQQESGDIDGLKDGAPHTRRSSHSSFTDLESEDGIDRSFYDIGPDGGIQILKSNPETSSSLYDIPPERKRCEKDFNPYVLPKGTSKIIKTHAVSTDAVHHTNTKHKHTDSKKCFKPGPKNRSQSYENVPNELIRSNIRCSAERQNYINVMKLPNISSKSHESPVVDTATPDKDSKVALKPPKLQPKPKTSCAHPSAKQAEAEKASIPASNRPESYENIPDEQINAKSSHAAANTQNRTNAGDTKDSSPTSRNEFSDVANNAENPPANLQNSQKSSKPGPNRPQAYENIPDGQMNTKLGSAVDTEYSNSLLNINKSPSKTNGCSATNLEFPLGGTNLPKIPTTKHPQPKSQKTANTAGPETYENVIVGKNGTVIIPQTTDTKAGKIQS